MQVFHRARQLARLVLGWFVLATGVAVAAPFVAPQSLQLVCTNAKSMRLMVKAVDGQEASPLSLHCPQCLVSAAAAPPPAVHALAQPVLALAYALQPAPQAHIARATRAPMPARGPPSLV